MKIKPASLSLITITLVFGGIALSSTMDFWKTTTSKIPATYTSGQYEGNYNPADIRGSYSFGDISSLFDIPLEYLGKAFEVDASTDISSFKCKDVEAQYGDLGDVEIGTETVRAFVGLYKGLPYDLADVYFPESAVAVLTLQNTLTPEQLIYLEQHTVNTTPSPSPSTQNKASENAASVSSQEVSQKDSQQKSNTATQNSSEQKQSSTLEKSSTSTTQVAEEQKNTSTSPNGQVQQSNSQSNTQQGENHEENSNNDKLIKGKTTFKEVLDWGISEKALEEILGRKLPSSAMAIRDFCSQEGIEFSDIKTTLQEMVDQL